MEGHLHDCTKYSITHMYRHNNQHCSCSALGKGGALSEFLPRQALSPARTEVMQLKEVACCLPVKDVPDR